MNNSSVTIVIPARYESSRFPGKPLARLAGKPLIQHVYEQAIRASAVEQVIVATDDSRIERAVEKFGGAVQMITTPCRTGTDRVAEVMRSLSHEVIINLQADEILLSPALLNDLITPFFADQASIGTLKREISTQDEFSHPSVVKVVTDQQGRALYFSRAPIPHTRDQSETGPTFSFASIHLGVYIFRRGALLEFAELPTGKLEDSEKLEQLRALEHGISIKVWKTQHPSLRIDTVEDLEDANRSWDRLMVGSNPA